MEPVYLFGYFNMVSTGLTIVTFFQFLMTMSIHVQMYRGSLIGDKNSAAITVMTIISSVFLAVTLMMRYTCPSAACP